MNRPEGCVRHSHVTVTPPKRALPALVFTILIAAWRSQAFCQGFSGSIALSAGSSSTTSYLSLGKSGFGSLNAALPLNLRNDFLNTLSFTAKVTIGSAEIAAGRMRLTALSYFSSGDRSGSRQSDLMGVAALGASADPWGLALLGRSLSLAITTSELCSSAALQCRIFSSPLDFVIGAGALYEMSAVKNVLQRLSPWVALGLHHEGYLGGLNVRTQVYPELAREQDSPALGLIRGAAGSADLALRFGKMAVRAFSYLEDGDFLGASGAVSIYDAVADVALDMDLSNLPIVRDAKLTFSVKSLQGAHSTAVGLFPSYGRFQNPFALKYWPDSEKIELTVAGKRVRLVVFGNSLWASLECGASGENMRGALSATIRTKAMIAESDQRARAFSLEAALTGESEDVDDGTEVDSPFSDIAQLEQGEESILPLAGATRFFSLNQLAIAIRASSPKFSFSCSMRLPIKSGSSDGLTARLRASIKLPQCSLEASASMEYANTDPHVSISTVRLYVRVPF